MPVQDRIVQGFTIIEHPSDVGIEARGASLKDAFVQAAYGLMSIIVERETVYEAETKTVVLASTDYERLLVKWLSELVYLYDGNHFLAAGISIDTLTHDGLSATIRGETFDASRHRVLVDVKAVTYHQLVVDPEHNFVRFFLDV